MFSNTVTRTIYARISPQSFFCKPDACSPEMSVSPNIVYRYIDIINSLKKDMNANSLESKGLPYSCKH